MTIHEGQIVGLPFSARIACIFRGLNLTKDCADTLDSLHATVSVDNLSFIHAAKVDSTVSIFLNQKFNMEPKVFEYCLGSQIGVCPGRTEIGFGCGVDQHAVFDTPAVDFVLFVWSPASKVFSVKE